MGVRSRCGCPTEHAHLSPRSVLAPSRCHTHTHPQHMEHSVCARSPDPGSTAVLRDLSPVHRLEFAETTLTCRKKPKGDKADGGPPPPRGRHAVRYSCIPHGAIIKRSSPLFTSEGEWGDGEQPGVSAISQARVPSGWSDLQPLQGFGDLVGGVGTNVTGGGGCKVRWIARDKDGSHVGQIQRVYV